MADQRTQEDQLDGDAIRAHDDAEKALAEQTPVKVRVPMVMNPDGTYYLDLTTQADKAFLDKAITFFYRIAKHSQGDVARLASTIGIAAIDLSRIYDPEATGACREIIKEGIEDMKAKAAARNEKKPNPK